MLKKLVGFALLGISIVLISGCAISRQGDLQAQGLRNQVSVLEAQLQAKDDEINDLREALDKKTQEETNSHPSAKQIQMALRNAGFDPGSLDGRMGKKTRNAIKAFQAANNLDRDGKAGKQTWALLKGYLHKEIK